MSDLKVPGSIPGCGIFFLGFYMDSYSDRVLAEKEGTTEIGTRENQNLKMIWACPGIEPGTCHTQARIIPLDQQAG